MFLLLNSTSCSLENEAVSKGLERWGGVQMFIHLHLMRSKFQCSYNSTTVGLLLYIGSLLLYPEDRGCTSVRNVSVYLRNMTPQPIKNLHHISRPENLKILHSNFTPLSHPHRKLLNYFSPSILTPARKYWLLYLVI